MKNTKLRDLVLETVKNLNDKAYECNEEYVKEHGNPWSYATDGYEYFINFYKFTIWGTIDMECRRMDENDEFTESLEQALIREVTDIFAEINKMVPKE